MFDEEYSHAETSISSIEDKYSIPILMLTLKGMNLRAQHRALDSRINLALRDIDIEDYLGTYMYIYIHI
jgi:stress-induced morphogen